jgi:hypothetical protein
MLDLCLTLTPVSWEYQNLFDIQYIFVEADKIGIYEVISNLLTNATKFIQKSNSDTGEGISTITVFTDI